MVCENENFHFSSPNNTFPRDHFDTRDVDINPVKDETTLHSGDEEDSCQLQIYAEKNQILGNSRPNIFDMTRKARIRNSFQGNFMGPGRKKR